MEALPIDKEAKRFRDHLDLPENHRIILSGIFGIGKSYFIEEFFKEHGENYIIFKLNPVNYAVSNNDDIFELIKFDIAFQLMEKGVQFDKITIGREAFTEHYLKTNYKEIIKTLITNLKKINREIDAVFSTVMDIVDKFEKEREGHQKDEKLTLKEFIDEYLTHSRGPREENDITTLINVLLDNLRKQHPKKKLVLAIDDLDRIDPEHIFRILNVFSAHFDFYEGANKFDIDKVVLICDIENIRGIFHHRYGTNIDFTGYIDKFYSTEVFHYNFREVIVEYIPDILRKIKIKNTQIQDSFQEVNSSGYYASEISRILGDFVKFNIVNMRTLVRFLRSDINIDSFKLNFSRPRENKIHNTQIPLLNIFELLKKLLGGDWELEQALIKMDELVPYIGEASLMDWWERTVGTAVMLIDVDENKLEKNKPHTFEDPTQDLKVTYEIHRSRNVMFGETKSIQDHQFEIPYLPEQKAKLKETIPYYPLLLEAYKQYKRSL